MMIELKQWSEFMFDFWKLIKKYQAEVDFDALVAEANTIMNKYSDVIKKNGKLIICGYNIDIKLNEIEHTNNELNALKLISI